jgi:hypothetical protein
MTLTGPPPPPPICIDPYETNDISSQAKAINLGVAISGIISSANDVDWFKVSSPNYSNTNLAVTLSHLPADYDLYVYDKRLKLLVSSAVAGNTTEVVNFNSNARKATYYIKVQGKNGAYNVSQCYNLLALVNNTARAEIDRTDRGDDFAGTAGNPLLYPNPATSFVNLQLNSSFEGPAVVQILNTVGQLVKVFTVSITRGYNQVRFPVNDILPGTYLLRINKGDLIIIRRFVKTR